ncbi:MAG: RcnB family protein [Gallionellaceae bacterium]
MALPNQMETSMNRKAIVSTIMAMSLTTSGFAFAEGNGDQHDRGGNEHAEQQERGAGPHGYHKGDRLPAAEHTKRYVVRDWRSHHLRAPPKGYHWVQSGNDFILVAISSGIIADFLLSR